MAATDLEGNILPKFSSSKPSVLSPPPRASGPVPTPCTRLGVLLAAVPPPLSPFLVSDLAKVYEIAVKTKQQLASAQMEIKKMSKVLKSRRRRAANILSRPSVLTQMRDVTTQVVEAPAVSCLCNSWANLLMQLRSQSSSQIQELKATVAAKDCQVKHQKREVDRLNIKVATLTHDNNLAHLAMQQNMPTYSSSSSTGSVSITGSVFDSTMPDSEPETLGGDQVSRCLIAIPRSDGQERGGVWPDH